MANMNMKSLKIPGFHGHSVKFSPMSKNILALTGGSSYGLSGKGGLKLLSLSEHLRVQAEFEAPDVITDCSWHPGGSLVSVSCGDGSIFVFEVNPRLRLIFHARQHESYCSSLDWSPMTSLIASCSWDNSIKIWDLNQGCPTLALKFSDGNLIHDVTWSSKTGFQGCFANDNSCQVFDTRIKSSSLKIIHGCDVLSVIWSKFDPDKLVTGSADGLVRVWDLKMPNQPTTRLFGHDYAVRKVVESDNLPSVIYSCSFDLTIRSWRNHECFDVKKINTEFVHGLDQKEDILASCSWDSSVNVFSAPT